MRLHVVAIAENPKKRMLDQGPKAKLKAKLYDLATVVPLILWLTLGIAGSCLQISEARFMRATVIVCVIQFAMAVLFFLVIILLTIRRTPRRKARGLLPRLTAITGCLLPFVLIALPRGHLPPLAKNLSSIIALLGVLASIAAVYYLGRSFSIFPQARALMTDGPYRFVRHPLYLAEFVVLFGSIWEINQPWPLVVVVAAIGIQLPRMHFEERVLSEEFPEYREYAGRTARIIPGLY
jgi:protein-S-isoprenylcysteine O-methyltransferase Ste14